MKCSTRMVVLPFILVVAFSSLGLSAEQQAAAEAKPFRTAEGVVRELYRLVTVKAGANPDWEKVRSLFLKNAVIALRTSPDNATVFSVQGFVDDFVAFNERAQVKETGFSERVVRLKATVSGDIAHVLVLYEASIPGSPRPPQRGVDSFQLIREDGRWWIVAVTNDLPSPNNPIPQELQK